MKSTKTAWAVTAVVVVLAILFGSHRSLSALRAQAVTVFEQGQYGDGLGVKSDLEKQHGVCANVYTVAQRHLDGGDAAMKELAAFFDKRYDPQDPELVRRERETARQVLDRLEAAEDLGEKDRGYVSDLRAQLQSLELTIARDPYNDMAETFNTGTLAAFPANLLHGLTGVRPLEVYR